MTRHDEDGDLAGTPPADTLDPDAALIARLRHSSLSYEELSHIRDDAADRIEALTADNDSLAKSLAYYQADRWKLVDRIRHARGDATRAEADRDAALLELHEAGSEELERPLWRRISNQRRALRALQSTVNWLWTAHNENHKQRRAAEARLARAEECIERARMAWSEDDFTGPGRGIRIIQAYDAAKEASDG